jgi:hypothetical protein
MHQILGGVYMSLALSESRPQSLKLKYNIVVVT